MNQSNGGDILFHFKGDTKDLEQSKIKAESVFKGIGNVAKSMGAMVAGAMATASVAVVGLVSSAVKAYAEMEQLEGGAQKIFNEMDYSKIEKDAVKAYKNMNMSARQYLSAINTVGANFASTLGDEKGYETAKKGLQAISDYASGTGQNVDLLSQKFQAIAKSTSSYQSIADQFAGVLPATSADFLAQAQAVGFLGEQYTKLSDVPMAEYQQALAGMLELGTKNLGLAGNTMAESVDTITGSIASAKGAFDNFLTGKVSISEVIETMTNAGRNIGKAFVNIAPDIVQGIVEVVKEISNALPGIINTLLPVVVDGAVQLLEGLVQSLPTFIETLAKMLPELITSLIQGFVKVIDSLADSIPQIIPPLIDAIIDGILAIVDNIDVIIDAGIKLIIGLTDGLIEGIPRIIERMPEIIEALISALLPALPKLASLGPKMMISLAKGLINAIPTLVLRIPRIISAIVNGLIQGVGEMFNVGKQLIKGLWNGIKGMKDWVINKVKSIGRAIIGGLKDILGIHSPSTEFALVGKYSILGYTEELDKMRSTVQDAIDDTFSLNPNLTNAPHFSSNVIVNNELNMNTDPLGQVVGNIKTFAGGAKNDYNYGMGV